LRQRNIAPAFDLSDNIDDILWEFCEYKESIQANAFCCLGRHIRQGNGIIVVGHTRIGIHGRRMAET